MILPIVKFGCMGPPNTGKSHLVSTMEYPLLVLLADPFEKAECYFDRGLLDPAQSPVFGVVVETMCRFHRSVEFPDTIEAGIRVAKIGSSSVTYELALFRKGDPQAAATGHFVHVYVDRGTRRPAAIPSAVRAELEKLRAEPKVR